MRKVDRGPEVPRLAPLSFGTLSRVLQRARRRACKVWTISFYRSSLSNHVLRSRHRTCVARSPVTRKSPRSVMISRPWHPTSSFRGGLIGRDGSNRRLFSRFLHSFLTHLLRFVEQDEHNCSSRQSPSQATPRVSTQEIFNSWKSLFNRELKFTIFALLEDCNKYK